VALNETEFRELVDRYAAGPKVLAAALEKAPEPARKWRPGPARWSVHEVVCHCADSETVAAARLRYLLAEPDPLIVGYDQARWADVLDYHSRPIAPALAAVAAVRANTVPLLEGLSREARQKTGRHSESGRYGVEDWLRIYAEHLEKHAGQIERNIAAWRARGPEGGKR
jgi:DinB superfamily